MWYNICLVTGGFTKRKVGPYLCQRGGVCREQDCRLELRNPRIWLAPGGAVRWFLGIWLAPHSWGQRSRSNQKNGTQILTEYVECGGNVVEDGDKIQQKY